MSAPVPRRVLLAAISPASTCTIGFCASLLKVQTQLTRRPDVQASIRFFPTQKDAFDVPATEYDTIVCVDAEKAVPPEFMLDPLPEDVSCLMSPYPLPIIDWDRVQRKLGCPYPSTEPPENVGNVYNFDPSRATPISPQCVSVPRDAVREWGVVKCASGVDLASVREVHVDLHHPTVNHGTIAFTGCVGWRNVLRGSSSSSSAS